MIVTSSRGQLLLLNPASLPLCVCAFLYSCIEMCCSCCHRAAMRGTARSCWLSARHVREWSHWMTRSATLSGSAPRETSTANTANRFSTFQILRYESYSTHTGRHSRVRPRGKGKSAGCLCCSPLVLLWRGVGVGVTVPSSCNGHLQACAPWADAHTLSCSFQRWWYLIFPVSQVVS